jgi:hypothetical protein
VKTPTLFRRVLYCCCGALLAGPASVWADLTINPPAFPATNTLRLTLSGTQPGTSYIIYSTPSLAAGASAWTGVATGSVGQVSFDLTMPGGAAMFYRAGAAPNSVAPYAPSVFNAITGPGYLQSVGSASNCVSANVVWLTNVACALTKSNGLTLTFSILGGADGAPYDVFATTSLGGSPQWTWMGQGYHCNTYALTNMPPNSYFLILGTPQDTDQDGLTDAYETLITQTDPLNPSTSGDGILDGWKVVWGMNLFTNNTQQPAERSNYGYNLTDWLTGVSGLRNGTINLDPQGNVMSVSQ